MYDIRGLIADDGLIVVRYGGQSVMMVWEMISLGSVMCEGRDKNSSPWRVVDTRVSDVVWESGHPFGPLALL